MKDVRTKPTKCTAVDPNMGQKDIKEKDVDNWWIQIHLNMLKLS